MSSLLYITVTAIDDNPVTPAQEMAIRKTSVLAFIAGTVYVEVGDSSAVVDCTEDFATIRDQMLAP